MAARIALATFGSLGDLHPYLAIARELRRRGHAPVLATLGAYRARVEAEGIEFHAVRPEIDPNDPEELRRVMDKRQGPKRILRDFAFKYLREGFEDCREAARGAELIVTHPVGYGMLLAARVMGLPWASVALAPLSLLSTLDPCVWSGMPFADALAGCGPGVQRLLQRLVDAATRRWLGPYRQLEAELGLEPSPNPVLAGQHSPHLVLALFSKVLSPPQPDWPAATVATGFPFFEQEYAAALPPELCAFLDGGPAPIVFTLGSAAVGSAGDFFAQSAAAAERLGSRAVLLVGGNGGNVPPRLPAGVLAVPYAPHALVFARASVIVHQGGIGTTGEAMRAGRPMLVVPYAHDQPDHARRLRRLGVARAVPRERYGVETAVRELGALLREPDYASRAAGGAARVRAESGTQGACDAIERLLHLRGR